MLERVQAEHAAIAREREAQWERERETLLEEQHARERATREALSAREAALEG